MCIKMNLTENIHVDEKQFQRLRVVVHVAFNLLFPATHHGALGFHEYFLRLSLSSCELITFLHTYCSRIIFAPCDAIKVLVNYHPRPHSTWSLL